jgi:hypothetical protein
VRALEFKPQMREASTVWLSPALRLRSERLGKYFTASSVSIRLTVCSIRSAVMLATVCGI